MKQITKIILCLAVVMVGVIGCGREKDDKNTMDNMTATSADSAVPSNTENQKQDEASPTDTPKTDEDGFVVRDDYVMAIEDYVNIRTAPDTDAPIYRIVEKGEVLKRTGDNAQWTRINMEETSFYVFSEFLEVTDPPAEENTESPEASATDASVTDAPKSKIKKVVIDAGNQANPNYDTEIIGPNSTTKKQCVTAGNVGIALGIKEYEINLIYAKALETELKSRGYEVIMTRNSDSDDISNKERAEIANAQGASALIRIQMNYSTNTKLSGVMALCMTQKSPYNASLYKNSYELSTRLLQGILAEVDTTNRGIYETDELTLVNYSLIPVAVLKLGFLSNVQEEANIASEEYQKNIVQGIANGLDLYFAE